MPDTKYKINATDILEHITEEMDRLRNSHKDDESTLEAYKTFARISALSALGTWIIDQCKTNKTFL